MTNLLLSILPLCVALGYLTPKLIDQFSQGNPHKAGRAYAININWWNTKTINCELFFNSNIWH